MLIIFTFLSLQRYCHHYHHDADYLSDTAKQTARGVQRFFPNVNVSQPSSSHQTLTLHLLVIIVKLQIMIIDSI